MLLACNWIQTTLTHHFKRQNALSTVALSFGREAKKTREDKAGEKSQWRISKESSSWSIYIFVSTAAGAHHFWRSALALTLFRSFFFYYYFFFFGKTLELWIQPPNTLLCTPKHIESSPWRSSFESPTTPNPAPNLAPNPSPSPSPSPSILEGQHHRPAKP